MHWLERTPLWVIGLVILIALTLAEQLGYVARRLETQGGKPTASAESFGYILSAAMALLGLLIAFTFSAASERFDLRRILVVEEANAIGTTYLRVQALDAGPKAALSQLIVQYGRARMSFFDAGDDSTRLQLAEANADDLQARIWAETMAAVRANPSATINPSLLQTTNEMFDLAASRRAAMDARLPIAVVRTLLTYALLAAAILGYGIGQGPREIVICAALFLAISLAICLILDLDRERSGTVTVDQAPMARAIASLERMEAAKPLQTPPPPTAP